MSDELKRFYVHKATGRDIAEPRKKTTSWKLVETYGGRETVLATGSYALMVWTKNRDGRSGLTIKPN